MINEAIRRVERGDDQDGCPVCAVARRVRKEGLSREEGDRLLAELRTMREVAPCVVESVPSRKTDDWIVWAVTIALLVIFAIPVLDYLGVLPLGD